jgi:hypothetical protein
MIEDKHLYEAIDRIARTPDGRTLYLFLQKRLMAIPTSAKTGALRSDHGERYFASQLMGLMAKGIEDSGRRTGSSGDTSGGSAEPLVVFALAEPRSVGGGSRGAGRRITADTRVPGWDTEAG